MLGPQAPSPAREGDRRLDDHALPQHQALAPKPEAHTVCEAAAGRAPRRSFWRGRAPRGQRCFSRRGRPRRAPRAGGCATRDCRCSTAPARPCSAAAPPTAPPRPPPHVSHLPPGVCGRRLVGAGKGLWLHPPWSWGWADPTKSRCSRRCLRRATPPAPTTQATTGFIEARGARASNAREGRYVSVFVACGTTAKSLKKQSGARRLAHLPHPARALERAGTFLAPACMEAPLQKHENPTPAPFKVALQASALRGALVLVHRPNKQATGQNLCLVSIILNHSA